MMDTHRLEKAAMHVQVLELWLEKDKERQEQILAQTDDVKKQLVEVKKQLTALTEKIERPSVHLPHSVSWSITNLPSVIQDHPTGSRIRSPAFTLGNLGPFYIHFYPSGHQLSSAGHYALFLAGPEGVKVMATMTVTGRTMTFEEHFEVAPDRGWPNFGRLAPNQHQVEVKCEITSIIHLL